MRATRGLTLIELVVAMSLFALVAVMGLQALSGQLFVRDRLVSGDKATTRLSLALSLLRSDLAAIAPVAFVPAGGNAQSIVAVNGTASPVEIAMTLGGQVDLRDPRPAALHRVIWRWDAQSGALSRHYWNTLLPDPQRDLSGGEVVLDDVSGITLELYRRGLGWQRLLPRVTGSLTGATDLGGPDGIRITVESRSLGRLLVVEALE